jgi:hypothetical protein
MSCTQVLQTFFGKSSDVLSYIGAKETNRITKVEIFVAYLDLRYCFVLFDEIFSDVLTFYIFQYFTVARTTFAQQIFEFSRSVTHPFFVFFKLQVFTFLV